MAQAMPAALAPLYAPTPMMRTEPAFQRVCVSVLSISIGLDCSTKVKNSLWGGCAAWAQAGLPIKKQKANKLEIYRVLRQIKFVIGFI
jgi:hypothetical protein